MLIRPGSRKLLAYTLSLAAIVAMAILKVGDPYAVATALAVFVGGNSVEHFSKRTQAKKEEK